MLRQKETEEIPLHPSYFVNNFNNIHTLYNKENLKTTKILQQPSMKNIKETEVLLSLLKNYDKYLKNALANSLTFHADDFNRQILYDFLGYVEDTITIPKTPSLIYLDDISEAIFEECGIGSIIVLEQTLTSIMSEEFNSLLRKYFFDFAVVSIHKNIYSNPFDKTIYIFFIHKLIRPLEVRLKYHVVNYSDILYDVLTSLYRKQLMYLQYFLTGNDTSPEVQELLELIEFVNESVQNPSKLLRNKLNN